jgi:hypothetical protein
VVAVNDRSSGCSTPGGHTDIRRISAEDLRLSNVHGENLMGGTNTFVPRGPALVDSVPSWSTDQFDNTIRTGKDPSGVQLSPDLMRGHVCSRVER